MSGSNRTTITRRSALRSGGIAAIAAGLLGTAAPAFASLPQLATVVNAEDLAQVCRDLAAEHRAARDREGALHDKLRATWTPEQRSLMIEAADANTAAWCAELNWRIVEIARHLPGLAPAILMLSQHFDHLAYSAPSECCTLATGYDS